MQKTNARQLMGSAEDQVDKILNGEAIQVSGFDSSPETVRSVAIRKNVCYIVSAVIFNDKNEVLMMQEAKRDCYKTWYLPAGRMEENETIVEGMRREVKEETGLECDPVTLLLVEESGPSWIRFTFLAEVTGGSIKTTAEADSESLQAQWWDRVSPLPLRAKDILHLIEAGVKYKESPWFPHTLPVELPCSVICQRVMVTYAESNIDLWLMLAAGEHEHLPVTVSGTPPSERSHTVEEAVYRLVKECMQLSQVKIKTLGILGLQHHGKNPGNTDGICFNTLLSIEHNSTSGASDGLPPVLNNDKFRWWKVDNDSLKDKILQRLASLSVVPIHALF